MKPVETPGAKPAVHVRFTPLMLIGLAALQAMPWILLAWLILRNAPASSPRPEAAARTDANSPLQSPPTGLTAVSPATQPSSGEIVKLRPGPWGKLDTVSLTIDVPDEYVAVPNDPSDHVRWIFPGSTRDQVLALFRADGLTEDQVHTLEAAHWDTSSSSVWVDPSDDLILSLTSAVRSKLYSYLIRYTENRHTIDPYWFRPGGVDYRLEGGNLSPDSIALLKKLLYPVGDNLLLFGDVGVAIRQIKDPDEQRRFIKAISRKRTLMLRLAIEPETDVNALAEYWGRGGREKDIAPLLDSLRYNAIRAIEPQVKINSVYLLPPFARERLYNYAFAKTMPGGLKEDCYWSAMNFFATDATDDRINDMDYTAAVLQRDYYAINEPGKLGDLILLSDTNGAAVHAAAYIADDVVFTKNGESHTQPWMLMRMQDMMDTYHIFNPDVQPRYFRKKAMP